MKMKMMIMKMQMMKQVEIKLCQYYSNMLKSLWKRKIKKLSMLELWVFQMLVNLVLLMF